MLTHSSVFRTERVASHAHRPPRLGQCMTLSAGWYELLFFAAEVFFPASAFIPFDLFELWPGFGTLGPGSSVLAGSAISSPNRAARSPPSSTLAGLGAGCANVRSCPALASKSCSSTLRNTNRSWGCSSSLAPTPYRAAATCLHMSAQSGQLQDSLISSGDGNRPSPVRQTRSMTPFDKRPCRSSTNESMVPALSRQIAFQRAAGTGAMAILTLYSEDPATMAAISPFLICRSTTKPERTYVRPRAKRFS